MGWLFRAEWRSLAALLLLAAAGLALFLPPGRVVFDWNDEGIYPNIAALMREEGRIHTSVGIVEEVAPERRSLLFPENRDRRLPFQAYLYKQYFITDFAGGKVVQQFYNPWPSLMGPSRLPGDRAYLLSRPLWPPPLAPGHLLRPGGLGGVVGLGRGRTRPPLPADALLLPLHPPRRSQTMALFCGGCLALLAAR